MIFYAANPAILESEDIVWRDVFPNLRPVVTAGKNVPFGSGREN
ncbi:hypothetical protein [Erwinia tracheiphila]|nr:hypothetical protein [Erwinia tracheiphila]